MTAFLGILALSSALFMLMMPVIGVLMHDTRTATTQIALEDNTLEWFEREKGAA